MSGSINCIKHLQATAVEAGVDVDVFALFNELGEQRAGAERRAPERRRHDRRVRSRRRRAGAAQAARAAARSRRADGHRAHARREPRRRRGRTTTTSSGRSIAPFSRHGVRSSCCAARSRPRARSSSPACARRASTTQLRGTARSSTTTCPTRSRRSQKGELQAGARARRCAACGPKGGPGDGGLGVARGVRDRRRRARERRRVRHRRPALGAVQQRADGRGGVAGVRRRRTAGARRERRSRSRSTSTRARSTSTCPRPSSRRAARGAASPRCRTSTGISVDLPAQRAADVHGRGAGQRRIDAEGRRRPGPVFRPGGS